MTKDKCFSEFNGKSTMELFSENKNGLQPSAIFANTKIQHKYAIWF